MLVECVYFFFFKQKTAYEMRISDWSSDVCSSDLDDRRVAKLERLVQLKVGVACNPALDEVGGRGFDDVDPRQSVSGEVLKGKGSARGGKELTAIQGRQDIAQPTYHDARDLVVGAHGHLHARHALKRRRGRRVRSEEHPSELQSLM